MMKKYFSRRFLVFVVATVLVAVGRISDWVWLLTGIAYISMDTLEKVLRGGQNA
jgi:hypothetical protein